ncbi:MAG: DUF2510 domain-containing protein [Actinobacteria bacterium]|nr:DUF2510 domain-containing protein [Actinomycetota bacterium]
MGTLFDGAAGVIIGLLWLLVIGVVAGLVWGFMRRTPRPRVKGPDGKKVDAPPGWYPAPGGRGQRYWNGTEWTDHQTP